MPPKFTRIQPTNQHKRPQCIEDDKTELVIKSAREAGATGSTVIGNARGEGLKPTKTFFGLTLESQRDVILFLVEQHLCRHILETIRDVAEFETRPGQGIALQLDVEDAVGVSHQVKQLTQIVEKAI
jgi:hypothetical protein